MYLSCSKISTSNLLSWLPLQSKPYQNSHTEWTVILRSNKISPADVNRLKWRLDPKSLVIPECGGKQGAASDRLPPSLGPNHYLQFQDNAAHQLEPPSFSPSPSPHQGCWLPPQPPRGSHSCPWTHRPKKVWKPPRIHQKWRRNTRLNPARVGLQLKIPSFLFTQLIIFPTIQPTHP